MKNSTNKGVDQHYNPQVAVDQDSRLIVANTLSNHPNDQAEAIPTLDAIPVEVGQPAAAALDHGYFSAHTIEQIEARKIEPYIATGREEPPQLASLFRGTADAAPGGGYATGEDGVQTSDRHWQIDLWFA